MWGGSLGEVFSPPRDPPGEDEKPRREQGVPGRGFFAIQGPHPGATEKPGRSEGSLREDFLRSRDPPEETEKPRREQGVPEGGFFAIQGPRLDRSRSQGGARGPWERVFCDPGTPPWGDLEAKAGARGPWERFFCNPGTHLGAIEKPRREQGVPGRGFFVIQGPRQG